MAAGRNVIGILGPAAAVGLGFFVPTVFYGVQPTPDTTTQLRAPYLSPPFKFRNNQIDASQGMPLALLVGPAPPPFTPDLSDGPYSVRRFAPDQIYPNIALANFVASSPRTPVLTPPFKVRISQSDASQPLNLAIQPAVQNPFIPVDYNISHEVISAPPQHPPYNINIFTNPIPFIPVDYNISHDVISSPPQARPYNINLQTNPIPFGPYDYSDGAIQFRLRVPDPIERNPLIFSEVPFVPVDYNISHDVANVPPLIPAYNILIYSEVPFIPPDLSEGVSQFRVRQPDQTYPNIALTTVVTVQMPFGPFDWSKASAIKGAPPAAAPPYNPNLYTNPIPFGPFDYQIEHDVISAPPQHPPYNINIFTNPIPFGPFDWTARAPQMPSRAPDQIERNPNIFSEVPFVPVDYNIAHGVVRSPPQPQPYNPNIFRNPIPFGPFDYNIAHTVVSSPPQALPYNPNLYTNPFPFGPYDWSARPAQFPPRAPDQIYYNISLNVTPPPPAPFAQYDWSKPFFPFALKDNAPQTNINLLTNPIPFGPFDWTARPPQMPPRAPDQIERNPLIFSEVPIIPVDYSARPQQYPPRAPDQIYYNISLNVTPPPPQPFAQYDWSKPFYPRTLKENASQTNINLMPNPIPFGPYDWSARPQQYPPRAPDVFHRNPLIFSEVPLISTDFSKSVRVTAPPLVAAPPYNVALYQPPPTPVDLSTSRRLPGLPPQPQPYNIALLTPTGPAPFTPIDWSKPFAIRQAALQAQLNLTITLPPPPAPPIVPFDWNRPYAVRLSPPQPQPNLTLFLPPPVIIGVPGLAFSKDFALAIFRAYDAAAAKTKAADLMLWKGNATDMATAKAGAKDVAVLAEASLAGRQPGLVDSRFPSVPAPVIINVSPNSGPSGTIVTITGTGLSKVTEVLFDGVPAVFTIIDDTKIIATVP